MGDFNIQINCNDNPDSQHFLNSMMALGFEQHVEIHTHKEGNILDHIYSEVQSDFKITNVLVDEQIFDHNWIVGNINVKRSRLIQHTKTMRNFKDIDIEKFFEDTNFSEMVDD